MCVYLVQSGGDDGPIKIGFSKTPYRRFETMRTANVGPLRLLAIIPASMENERQLHARFAEHRLTGEWFSPVQEIAALAAEFAASFEPTRRVGRPSKIPVTELGRYLLRHRIKSSEFAAMTGCSRPDMSKLTTGARIPSLEIAVRIMDATNGEVRPESFIRDRARSRSAA